MNHVCSVCKSKFECGYDCVFPRASRCVRCYDKLPNKKLDTCIQSIHRIHNSLVREVPSIYRSKYGCAQKNKWLTREGEYIAIVMSLTGSSRSDIDGMSYSDIKRLAEFSLMVSEGCY